MLLWWPAHASTRPAASDSCHACAAWFCSAYSSACRRQAKDRRLYIARHRAVTCTWHSISLHPAGSYILPQPTPLPSYVALFVSGIANGAAAITAAMWRFAFAILQRVVEAFKADKQELLQDNAALRKALVDLQVRATTQLG